MELGDANKLAQATLSKRMKLFQLIVKNKQNFVGRMKCCSQLILHVQFTFGSLQIETQQYYGVFLSILIIITSHGFRIQ